MPRYVSTVDSGNLLASLWVFERGCRDLLGAPLLGPSSVRGIADTLGVLREEIGQDTSMAMPIRALRRLLHGKAEGHELIIRLRMANQSTQQRQDTQRWQEPGSERAYWMSCLGRELSAWIEIVNQYLCWMETLAQPPDSFLRPLGEEIAQLRGRAIARHPFAADIGRQLGRHAVGGRRFDFALARHTRDEAGSRGLDRATEHGVHAGARARGEHGSVACRIWGPPPESLPLASICASSTMPAAVCSASDMRWADPSSFRAITICWPANAASPAWWRSPKETFRWSIGMRLGRPRVPLPGGTVLLSWSGTMFEYLMPLLFMRNFANSLLDHACREAVRQQIELRER